MSDIEAVEILMQAKERLFECGWGQSTAAYRDAQGDTTSLCLEEALYKRGYYVDCLPAYSPVRRCIRYLRAAAGREDGDQNIWVWNDSQTTATSVFDAIDAAILLAKEASTPVEI